MQVLIATNEFGKDFWINLLLTFIAYIPGIVHSIYVVSRMDDDLRGQYTILPATLPSAGKSWAPGP